jgi:flavodoxin
VETPGGTEEIPYKEVDRRMYEISKSTFEGLAQGIAEAIAKKTQVEKVTVRVKEDPDFWAEAVEQKETQL